MKDFGRVIFYVLLGVVVVVVLFVDLEIHDTVLILPLLGIIQVGAY